MVEGVLVWPGLGHCEVFLGEILYSSDPGVQMGSGKFDVESNPVMAWSRGGGLPYETDGDASHVAQGCKFWILVSLRVFRAKCQYFTPPRKHRRNETRRNTELHEEKQKSNFLEIYDNAFKSYFQIKAFDDYVFISLKLVACRICVFFSGLFQGSKFA